MGVSGLLKALASITEPMRISDYAGKRVGIDGYCWLHRGVYGCAYELCNNIPTRAYIDFFLRMIRILLDANVIPIVVFDGTYLPQKADIEQDRAKLCVFFFFLD